MNRFTSLMALGISLLAGCEAASDKAPQLSERQRAELVEGCVASRERSAECRLDLVDGWIAVRAKYNPDIAGQMRTAEDKAALRDVALSEFEHDGTGPRAERVAACEGMLAHMPPQAIPLASEFSACNSATDCGAFSKCVLPAFEKMEIMRTQGP